MAMIVRQQGGLTEFIPSPQEKREGALRDHTLRMLENLDARLKRIEEELGLPLKEAEAFSKVMARIHREEAEARRINEKMIAAGVNHEERIES
jgi:hypothetical protein